MSLRLACRCLILSAGGDDDGTGGLPDAPPALDAMGGGADAPGCSGG